MGAAAAAAARTASARLRRAPRNQRSAPLDRRAQQALTGGPLPLTPRPPPAPAGPPARSPARAHAAQAPHEPAPRGARGRRALHDVARVGLLGVPQAGEKLVHAPRQHLEIWKTGAVVRGRRRGRRARGMDRDQGPSMRRRRWGETRPRSRRGRAAPAARPEPRARGRRAQTNTAPRAGGPPPSPTQPIDNKDQRPPHLLRHLHGVDHVLRHVKAGLVLVDHHRLVACDGVARAPQHQALRALHVDLGGGAARRVGGAEARRREEVRSGCGRLDRRAWQGAARAAGRGRPLQSGVCCKRQPAQSASRIARAAGA